MTKKLKSMSLLLVIGFTVVGSLLFKGPVYAAGWYYDRGFGSTGCDTYIAGPFGSSAMCNSDRSSYLSSCSGPCCGMYTSSCAY